MRLIESTTLQLVSKHGDDIPPYAILSHTWGSDDEEVTFQELQQVLGSPGARNDDFRSHPIAQRPGFVKILNAAKLARSDGYAFIWVDTCCIDKTSSAELSEAINSMFRWYQQSAVCYTFLNDVDDPEVGVPLSEGIRSAIAKSRWFTRGWTLQELIAPSIVRFYSKGWQILGEKCGPESLQSLISVTTGIEDTILDGSYELHEFSVANRMQWAARRKTTRIEDAAYCLMGIFNVNMPLLYGEGSRAFLRLQQEILKETEDQSLFAWEFPKDAALKYELSGLFAESPLWFLNSGGFRPLPSHTSDNSAPSSMTNAGLHVNLFLLPLSDSDLEERFSDEVDKYVGILHCRPYVANNALHGRVCKAAILLQHLGGDQYARVRHDTIFPLSTTKTPRHTYIYVKQNPSIEVPDIVVDDLQLSTGIHPRHSLYPLWLPPKARWDPATKTLRYSNLKSTGYGMLAIFRYRWQCPGIKSISADLIIGAHSRSPIPGKSNYWCFQQPATYNESTTDPSPPTGVSLRDSNRHNGVDATISSATGGDRYNRVTLKLSQTNATFFTVGQNSIYSTRASSQSNDPSLGREGTLKGHYISKYMKPLVAQDKFMTSGLCKTARHTIRCSNESHNPVSEIKEIIRKDIIKSELDLFPNTLGEKFGDMHQSTRQFLIAKCADISKFPYDLGRYSCQKYPSFVTLPRSMAFRLRGNATDGISLKQLTTIVNGFCLIHWAAFSGNPNALGMLLRTERKRQGQYRKVDLNKILFRLKSVWSQTHPWVTALHLAAMNGQVLALKFLLEGYEEMWSKTLNMDSSCKHCLFPFDSPIHLAASYVRSPSVRDVLDCFEKLKKSQPSTESHWTISARNTLGETPLHRAAAMNNEQAVLAILSQLTRSKDVDCLDNKSRTPLWHAAAAGSSDALIHLLGRAANPNARDDDHVSVLQAACLSSRSTVVIEALLAWGADPNGCTIFESSSKTSRFTCLSPITYAALGGNVEILKLLLNAGAKVDGPYESDLTALHIATARGHREFVGLLCKEGCDLDLRTPYLFSKIEASEAEEEILIVSSDREEKTALERARADNSTDFVRDLEAYSG